MAFDRPATTASAAVDTPRPTARHRVGVVLYEGFNLLDAAGPIQVFDTAAESLAAGGPGTPRAYSISTIGHRGSTVRASCGVRWTTDSTFDGTDAPFDTLLIVGGDARALLRDRSALDWVRRAAAGATRTASVCTGAFVLAKAGLLAGRRATTHWAYVDLLARHYPTTAVEPDALFVEDGPMFTSAGVAAGMDLALALVQRDHGRELALEVARRMVLFLKRPGGQSQFSSELSAQATEGSRAERVAQWVLEHLNEDLDVERLAAVAAMSPRNFARVFTKETGLTPAKFVENARISRARRVLEETDLSLEEIAERTGFGTAERMRRTFQRHLHVVPQDYRRRFEAPAQG